VPSDTPSIARVAVHAVGAAWIFALVRFATVFPGKISSSDLTTLEATDAVAGRASRLRRATYTFGRGTVSHPSVLWVGGLCVAALILVSASFRILGSVPERFFVDHLVMSLTPAWVALTFSLLTLALVAVSVWFLRAGYRLADARGRQQLLWILLGWIAAAVVIGVQVSLIFGFEFAGVSFFEPVLGAAMLWGGPATYVLTYGGLTIAVFFSGAFDVRPLVTQTTVYGVLGILFLFLFAGLSSLAEGLLQAGLGLSGAVSDMLTAGTSAVVLIPVQRRLDDFVNRMLPPTKITEVPTQISTIVFADVVGYASLAGEDQQAARTVVSVVYKAANRVAREHRGRLVRSVADEVLMEFEEVGNGMRAAADLREEFRERASELGLPSPEIYTGIHCGEVVREEDGDLSGDTVNVASRVHSVAGPGGVVLTQSVVDALDADLELEDLGEQTLRNVATPVRCYALRH
jgi:class 3 adenylate cyclase